MAEKRAHHEDSKHSKKVKQSDEQSAEEIAKEFTVIEHGGLQIQKLNLKGDYVTIINKKSEDVPLEGWRLRSTNGSQEFLFPADLVLKGGCTITVWSGRTAESKHNPPCSLFWTKKFIWNDKGDEAQLVDGHGNVVDSVVEMPLEDTPIFIQELDLKGDYVTIINTTENDVNFCGWRLKSVVGRQSFQFPDDFVLKAGATVTVWSGRTADTKHNPPSSFFWTKKFIWNDKGDDAGLYDATGQLIHTVSVHPANIPNKIEELKPE